MFLTRDEVLAAGVEYAEVTVPKLGTVRVRGLTVEEGDQYERACMVKVGDKTEFKNDRALAIRLGAVDAAGNHLFTDADLPRLRKLPHAASAVLFAAVNRLSVADEDQPTPAA